MSLCVRWLSYLVILLAGRPATAGEPPDLVAIRQRGVLVVAMTRFDHVPCVITGADGQTTGHDAEMARSIARHLGVELRLAREAASYDAVVDMVAGGQADLGLSAVSATLERATRVRFTRPYLTTHGALLLNRLALARRGAPSLERLATVPEFHLATLAGSAYIDYARRRLPYAQVSLVPDFPALVAAVRSGQAEAGLWDVMQMRVLQRQDPAINISLEVQELDLPDPLAIVVPVDRPHLHAWLELFLATSWPSTDLAGLLDHHLPPTAAGTPTVAPPPPERLPWAPGLAALVAMAAVGLAVRQGRRPAGPVRPSFWQHLRSPWAALAGLAAGLAWGLTGQGLALAGGLAQVYLALIQMCVLPILISALVTGTARCLQGSGLGLLVRFLIALPLALLVCGLTGLVLGWTCAPGSGLAAPALAHFGTQVGQLAGPVQGSPWELLRGSIPANLFRALADGDSLAVTFVAACFGLALGAVGGERTNLLLSLLESIQSAFNAIIQAALLILPFGLAGILAREVGGMGQGLLTAVLRLGLLAVIGSVLLSLLALMVLAWRCRLTPAAVWIRLRQALIIAFGTRSGLAALPAALDGLRDCGLPRDGLNLVLPLATTLCRQGSALLIALVVCFCAQLHQVGLHGTLAIQAVCASALAALALAGAQGPAMASILPLVLAPLSLPTETGIAVLLATWALCAPVLTVLNLCVNVAMTALALTRAAPAPDRCSS